MITAEQVREAMRTQELTQKQVANMAKISPSILSKWLSGQCEPSDVSKARVMLALGLGEPGELDDETLNAAMTSEPDHPSAEDAAAAEILSIISEPAPVPEPAPEPAPEPDPAPAEEASVPDKLTAAEMLYRLTRLPGCYLYTDRDGEYGMAVPRGSDLERFCRNLEALDAMLVHEDIAEAAHRIAAESLLDTFKRKEAES